MNGNDERTAAGRTELSSTSCVCQGCGASLKFDPDSRKLKCFQCGNLYDIELLRTVTRHNVVGSGDRDISGWMRLEKVIKCDTCGAEVVLNGLQYSSVCPYCGSNFVSETKNLPGLQPDFVIPFAFSEKNAAEIFAKGVKKKFFAPRALKKKLPENKIHGIYAPSFSFDFSTFSRYNGVLVRTETVRKGDKTKTVHHTFHVSGSHALNFEDMLVETSSKIEASDLNSLLPYRLENRYEYTPDFLYGYCVEHYADSLAHCERLAQARAENVIRHEILSQYDYTSVDYLNVQTDYSDRKFSYGLLPVYNFEFPFKGKNYSVVMNGQTGRIGKGLPMSKLKIALTALLGVAVVAGLIALWFLFGENV